MEHTLKSIFGFAKTRLSSSDSRSGQSDSRVTNILPPVASQSVLSSVQPRSGLLHPSVVSILEKILSMEKNYDIRRFLLCRVLKPQP